MTITMTQLGVKSINTQHGQKELWTFLFNGRRYESYKATWNKDWHEGKTVDIEDSQLKQKEFNGESYTQIYAPKKEFNKKGSFDSPERQSSIEAQNCLSHATALVVAEKISLDQLTQKADELFNWIQTKKGTSGGSTEKKANDGVCEGCKKPNDNGLPLCKDCFFNKKTDAVSNPVDEIDIASIPFE